METELAHAVDVMMARAKKIYISIVDVNKLFSFSSSQCFLKEIESMFFVFLSSFSINLLAFYHEAVLWLATLLKAYLHAAICRADLSAPRNRESNLRV